MASFQPKEKAIVTDENEEGPKKDEMEQERGGLEQLPELVSNSKVSVDNLLGQVVLILVTLAWCAGHPGQTGHPEHSPEV